MAKKELINRWNSPNGNLLLEEVIKSFKNGKPLSSVKGLEKDMGLWDLRGAPLSLLVHERKIEASNHEFVQKTGSLSFKKNVVDAVDFSYADISYSRWDKCAVKNCLFVGTKLKEITFRACDIVDCVFRKADMSYSFLNINIGENSGSFVGCVFKEVDLSEAIFNFPLIKNCLFEDCKFSVTVFDGSRFVDCKFKGTVNSASFMGYSVYASKSTLGIFNRIDPVDYPNKMENVDFSDAKLVDVSFTHGINLANCKLPDGDEYIIIDDLEDTMQKVKIIIDSEWDGEDRRLGLGMINNVYFKKNIHGKGTSIINTSPIPSSNIAFEKKFYSLLKTFS
jgi:uncharacterized protein YjbI with pentapeptide repeats